MIADTITQKIAKAMKAKDEIRLSTLRLLSSALNYERIEKQHALSEEEELSVVRREAKKRKEVIESFRQVQDRVSERNQDRDLMQELNDRIKKEKKELAILEEYLPAQMGDEELVNLVNQAIKETGAKSMADMGKVMGAVMTKTAGQADGSRVSEIVKEKLGSL